MKRITLVSDAAVGSVEVEWDIETFRIYLAGEQLCLDRAETIKLRNLINTFLTESEE